VNETAINQVVSIESSPALNTRSQLALYKEVGEGISQDVNTTMEVMTTPRKKK
jgi:hypothetical protein